MRNQNYFCETEPMRSENQNLKNELEFRLSLIRLLTEPHPPAAEAPCSQESRQLEELVGVVESR